MQPVLGTRIWAVRSAGLPLEAFVQSEQPVIAAARPLEQAQYTRVIQPAAQSGVAAFLDGIQRTHVVTHIEGVPLLSAFVAAVVRVREHRRMQTWRPARAARGLFLPRKVLGESLWRQLEAHDVPLYDTDGGADVVPHPLAFRRRALDHVSSAREQLEQQLAATWHDEEDRWLWVDGGVSGVGALEVDALESTRVFGVIKSHATLYGDPSMVATTLRLGEGERSSLFLVRHRVRLPVVSWYLRLRHGADADPLHGLVRVEVLAPREVLAALEEAEFPLERQLAGLTGLADRLSSWILAERLPVALPDARWDRLTYGVHDCEEYLAALAGTH